MRIKKGRIADQNTKMLEKERKAKTREVSRDISKNIKDMKIVIYCRIATEKQ